MIIKLKDINEQSLKDLREHCQLVDAQSKSCCDCEYNSERYAPGGEYTGGREL